MCEGYAPLATQIRRDLLSLERSEEAPAVAIALEAWTYDKPIGLLHPARRQPLRPRVLQFTAHAFSGGELKNYLREPYRLLRPGGAMMQPHSNIEHPPATYGTRHTFQRRMAMR
jgi:hypothetical protein